MKHPNYLFSFLSFCSLALCSLTTVAQTSIQPVNSGRLSQYSVISKTQALTEIRGNLSGVTFNYDTETYFLVQNNSSKIYEYSKEWKHLRTITLANLKDDDDSEGITYLGQEEFAISFETNRVLILKIPAGQTVVDATASLDTVQELKLPAPGKDNKGLEGVCFTRRGATSAGTLFAVQEKKPKRIFRFDRPLDRKDKGGPYLSFSEPFNADALLKHRLSDLSDCYVDDSTGHLLLLSHESSNIMELDMQGRIQNIFPIPKVADQYEGITIGAEGELVLVSEPNVLVIMK